MLVHDPSNRGVAHMLIEMPADGFPVALGRHLRRSRADLRERGDRAERSAAAKGKTPDLQALVAKGQTWMVEKEPHKI